MKLHQAIHWLSKQRGRTINVRHGQPPRVELKRATHDGPTWSLLIWGAMGLLAALIWGCQHPIRHHHHLKHASLPDTLFTISPDILRHLTRSLMMGFSISTVIMALYVFAPLWVLGARLLVMARRPGRQQLSYFTGPQKAASLAALALLPLLPFYGPALMKAFHALWYPLWVNAPWMRTVGFINWRLFLTAWILSILITYAVLKRLIITDTNQNIWTGLGQRLAYTPHALRLYLGESTGTLAERHHPAGMRAGQAICLDERDIHQNILILGGIGEGKTQGLIHSLLIQCLQQDCGGLVFDIKGHFHKSVCAVAQALNRTVVLIGPHHQRLNLLAGLSPEAASDMMRMLYAMHARDKSSHFWVNKAAQMTHAVLGILSFLPERYDLANLQRFIFDEDARDAMLAELETHRPEESRAQALLASYRDNLRHVEQAPERMMGDIKATLSSVLSHCTHPDIVESFCTHSEDTLALERTLDGTIFVVDLPKATYGQLHRTLLSFIKLRWFHVMEARQQHPDWNQTRSVFFMCDEFQSIVNAASEEGGANDLTFWDKARERKAFGIISAQSVSRGSTRKPAKIP